MSFQKINNLLASGDIINFNLISEQLKNTLIEVTNILQEHGNQITAIQGELMKKATKGDVQDVKEVVEGRIQENVNQIQKMNEDYQENINKTQEIFNNMKEDIQKDIKEVKQYFVAELANKEKEISGDIFVANQQIREINVKLIGQGTSIQKSQTEIQKINKLLDVGKDKSLELLAIRVEGCENKLNTLMSEHTTYQNDITTRIDEVAKFTNNMKLEFTNELHALNVGMKDVRHMVVDTPALDTDGPIDTPSLIRAIQRDSRRIDNFNETINSVRDDHIALRTMCTSMIKAFNEFQMNVADMVNENNNTRKDILKKADENEKKIFSVSKEVGKMYGNYHASVESFLSGITQVSNVINQISVFLSKLTSRQLPQFLTFDDCILELQQQSDVIAVQNERYEEKISNAEKEMKVEKKALQDFQLPLMIVNLPKEKQTNDIELLQTSTPALSKQKGIDVSSEAVSNTSSSQALDIASRHSLQEIQFKIDNILVEIEKIKNSFDEKLDKKADLTVMERFLDRNRLSINKLREKVNETMNAINNCVKKNEIKQYMLHNDSQQQSQQPDVLISSVQKPSTAAYQHRAQETLPRIRKSSGNSHSVIYGCDTHSRRIGSSMSHVKGM